MWKLLIVILQKQRTTTFLCTEGHLKFFIGRTLVIKVLMLHVHITILRRQKIQYLYNIFI